MEVQKWAMSNCCTERDIAQKIAVHVNVFYIPYTCNSGTLDQFRYLRPKPNPGVHPSP